MSGGRRWLPADAMKRALFVRDQLADVCERIEIAGSLRRKKPDVGDVEIVVLPKDAPTLLARLDYMVATAVVSKAVYSDRTNRWGEKYRGLTYDGVRIEVFLADVHNWGYIYWLRTGPGDANTWVMQQCSYRKAPYRAEGGYWKIDGQKIHVPDEREMFRLLGVDYVPTPESRSMALYERVMRWTWADELTLVDEPNKPTQSVMF